MEMEKKNLKRKSTEGNNSNITTSPSSSPKTPIGSVVNNSTNKNRTFKNNKKHRKSIDKQSNNNNINNNNNKTNSTNITKTTELLPNNIKLEENVEEDPNKVIRVYADGIYDLFHFGHARSLQQAKLLFKNTYLIVGVCNDEITHKLKGKTVMNSEERSESLRHCRWVDQVVENAPWIVTQEFIDKHNIDYVAHGEDLCLDKDGNDIYKFVKDQGKFKTIKRTDGISTSDIILRIVKDYDSYVMRNLSRGYTGKEMNVGVLKEKSLQFEEKINQFKSKVKTWSDQTENNIFTFLQRFSKRIPMNWDKKLLTSPTLSDSSSNSNGGSSEDNEDYEENNNNNISIEPISPEQYQSQNSPKTSFVINGLSA